MYQCRDVYEKQDSGESELREVHSDMLTKYILIQIRKVACKEGEEELEEANDLCTLKVNIHDPMSKIMDFYSVDSISGYLVANGQIIENLKDFTFAKKQIADGAKLGLVCALGGGGQANCLQWRRHKYMYLEHYLYLRNDKWDASCFIPRANITVHGFGVCGNQENKDMQLLFKWYIDEDESGEYEYDVSAADQDSEKKWHSVYLKELGTKPIRLTEGQKLHLCMRSRTVDDVRCYYGAEGYPERVKDFPD